MFAVQEILPVWLQGSNVDDSFDVKIELGSLRREADDRLRETVWDPAHGGLWQRGRNRLTKDHETT